MMGGKIMRGKMFRTDAGDDSDIVDSSSEESSSDDDSDGEGKKQKQAAAAVPPAPAAAKEAASKKQPDANKKSANLSSSDESEDEDDKKAPAKRSRDESDEEDSEEEEEEEEESAPKSKKKRPKISFFDEEAEASDDDDDDDAEKLKNKDVSKEYADEEAEAIMAQQDRRRQRAGGWLDNLGRLTEDKERDDSDVARIARELEERHRAERRVVPRGNDGRAMVERRARAAYDRGYDREGVDEGRYEDEGIVEEPSYTAVSQQSLVPSVSDPNLWMFSCPTGKEQELVYQIMNKAVAFAKRGRPLGITSVVSAQTKGKIYVESYSEPAVIEALQGVRGVMIYSMTKIPISDMTTVMTVVPKKVPGEFSE